MTNVKVITLNGEEVQEDSLDKNRQNLSKIISEDLQHFTDKLTKRLAYHDFAFEGDMNYLLNVTSNVFSNTFIRMCKIYAIPDDVRIEIFTDTCKHINSVWDNFKTELSRKYL